MYILKLVEKMNNVDLAECVKEILEWHDTGILPGNKIRILANEIEEIIKTSDHKHQLAEDIVLREAAKRFAENI